MAVALFARPTSPCCQARLLILAKSAGERQRNSGAFRAFLVHDGCLSADLPVHCSKRSVRYHFRSPVIPAPASSARFLKPPMLKLSKSETT